MISIAFVLDVAAAAWWGGAWAGILVSFATVPVLTLIFTSGRAFIPPDFEPVGVTGLCALAVLVDRISRWRKRVEGALQSANEALDARVRERTAELERSKAELERSKRWFQITLASIGDAVIATDQQGLVTFMNRIAEGLTGWTEQEACQRPLAEVFVIVDETTRQALEDPVTKVIRTGEITGLANHTVLISRDGGERPIDDSAAPILDEQNRMAGVVLIFRDITERRRNEKLAEEGRRALERTNYELQQFAYAASHDLQEPLRNVSLYTQLLERRYGHKLDGDGNEFIRFVVGGAARMQDLVKALLDYTSVSSASDVEITPMDLNGVVRDVLSDMRARIEETQAVMTCDELPTLPIHGVHAQQMFQNLIGNAVKYRSEQAPRIHISAVEQDHQWTFAVQDNGIGVDPIYRERIFGLFKRLHSAEKYAGTGIGLAICQRVVERYGGKIWVESEPGKGSTFFFTLPAQRDGG